MKEIYISTQAEFDKLPKTFKEFTYIYLKDTKETIFVRVAWENSTVEAWGNSTVVAWENSTVVAWGNSTVVAWGNSTVVARENSTVVAWGNSTVEARENSTVEAWENSTVEAWGNSTVEAWGNSTVVAWENSTVVAWGNVATYLQSTNAIVTLFMYAVCFVTSLGKVIKKSKTATIIKPKTEKGLKGWLNSNAVKRDTKGDFIIYKRVSKDFKTQEGTSNEFNYPIGKTVKIKDWAPKNNECGAGKLHACSRPYFCDEFRNSINDKYIAIKVNKKNVHVWDKNPSYPHKIAFRTGKVLYECDKFGLKITGLK